MKSCGANMIKRPAKRTWKDKVEVICEFCGIIHGFYFPEKVPKWIICERCGVAQENKKPVSTRIKLAGSIEPGCHETN